MKVPNFKENKGISLASLVVTVIVILILAAISLYMMTGDNNLIFRTGKAKEENERAEIEEALNAAYVKLERKSKYNSVANLDDAVEDVKSNGYEDRIVGQPGDGYELCGEDVTLTKIAPNNTKTITIKKDTSESSDGLWYAVIMGKYFKIEDKDGTIKIAKEPSNVEINSGSIGDKINITNDDVTIANANIASIEVIDGDKLKVTALNVGSSTITINSNGKTAICKVTVISNSITIPTAKTGLVYNGQNQTGVEDGSGYIVTEGKKVDAGNYKASISLQDKENTVWSDGTTADKIVDWSIAKKKITVTADNKTRKYGEENPTLTATVGETGVQGEKGKITGTPTTTAEKMSKVGSYPITRGGNLALVDNETFKVNNYEIDFKDGTLTITEAIGSGSVTIEGWTYGETAKNPVPTSSTNGTNNVTYKYKVSTAEDSTYTETKPSAAGTYIVQAIFAATDNYNEVTTTANFTIGQKEITVTAEDKNRAYGAENPTFTYTYSGVISGEEAGFTGALATEATETSVPGNYDITQGDLALVDNGTFKVANYKIKYTKAILRVDPKVTFNANSGTGTMSEQTVTYNTATALKQNTFTRGEYTFNGWNTKADGSGTSYADKAEITAKVNTTLYAKWVANTYTVEYYQGNNSITEGATKFSTTSSHTYGTASALKTYEQLGGTAPSGWTFAGWSTSETGTAVSTVNSVSLTDGASVTNLTNTANGTVKLYAVFKRNIVFKSGANAEKTDETSEQRYNPYKTTGYITSVTSPSALTAITGWTATGTGTGYRNDATAGAATLALNTAVTPAYNETNLTYYGTYTKVINVYSGVNKGTNNKQTQYLNTNGNKVSSISLAVPATIENWTAIGYRDDTTADDKETAVTTSAVSVTPAYSTSSISYYAVYSRTLTIKYNGNSPTSGSTASTTKTVYLNTNSTTTSSQQVTLANNGFIKNGYAFSKWAKGNTSGTKYAEGASYTAGLAYNASPFEVTMYAIWQDVYLRTSETSTYRTTAKFLYTTIERRKIKSISFANSISGHTVDGTTCFDVSSVTNSGQVLLWITNTDGDGYVDIVIGQNGGVKANPDSSYLFSYVGYTPSTFTINFTNYINTSNVTNMSYMFQYCGYTGMTSLNLGNNFDTSSVTNMFQMFYYCGYTAMTSLDLGDKFDTSSVTNMSYMFDNCGYTAMTSLDLGDKFDTSSVTNMSYMFENCGYTAMTSIDLGENFDTSSVTNMYDMFSNCGYTAMTSLDLGESFDTSSVTNMGYMFSNCGYTAMSNLDLGENFDTSSVNNMAGMFYGCGYKAMTSLDLGDKFDTSKVTIMVNMFSICGYTAMTSLDLGDKFNTSSVISMNSMFGSCGYTAMTSLDLGDKFDTSKVTSMTYMFSNCGYTAMTSLDLGDKFDTSSVTDMQYMFRNCGYTVMTSLGLGNKFDTSSVTNMSYMFQCCGYKAMTGLNLGNNFDTSNVTNMSYMFQCCGYKAMTSLDLVDKFDTSNVTNMTYMFDRCGFMVMTSLDLGDKFDTSKVTNMIYMFSNCGYTAMTSLDLGDKFDTSNVTNMSFMFYNCPNLVTIYATESFVTTNVTSGASMFTYDTKLVGGMGTTYSNSHIDHAYAHVDEGTTNPGYFTDKNTYYVEFDSNGGTGTMPRQPMIYGKASNLSTNTFTKPGYAFAGWNDKADGSGTSYTDGQSVLNLEDGLFKVKKLYAQWQDVYLIISEPITLAASNTNFLYTPIQRRKINSITFASSIVGHVVDETTCFDVSSIENSGQVLLWITNTDSNGYYDVVIGQNGGVRANPDSSYLFNYVGYDTPFTIDFTNFDTSSVTSIKGMFYYCGYKAMTSLDLGDKFDTSRVTNMSSLFYSCGRTAMTSLDLGDKFDTSRVTNMSSMFENCGYTAMTSLDLGDKFDTSNVTSMSRMFHSCGYTAMTSLDLGDKFDTSKVTNMDVMFGGCGYTAMTSLDLGNKFDTSKVTDMSSMFSSCGYTAMTSLDLGDKFDTSSVTDMWRMFNKCGYMAMTSLDFGEKFDTSSVTDMSFMFEECGYTAMTSLDLGDKFDTSKVTNMEYMFRDCGYKAMTSLDLGDKFDTSNVTKMLCMFSYCGHTAMTSLDLGDKFDTSRVTNMSSMFSHCGRITLTKLDISAMTFPSTLESYEGLFNYCGKSNCQVYVKSTTEKTWVETNKNSYWSNSNIIVGHLN